MAGVGLRISESAIATGTSKKTLVQIEAAAHHGVIVKSIGVSFDGDGSDDILCEVAQQSTVGSGSSSATVTDFPVATETPQTVAKKGFTGEPTETAVLASRYVRSNSSHVFHFQGDDVKVDGSGRLGIAVTAATNVNATVDWVCEE